MAFGDFLASANDQIVIPLRHEFANFNAPVHNAHTRSSDA
jgi:hypothetical protein